MAAAARSRPRSPRDLPKARGRSRRCGPPKHSSPAPSSTRSMSAKAMGRSNRCSPARAVPWGPFRRHAAGSMLCRTLDNAGRISIFKPATWPGTKFDWAFAMLATILVVAGYSDAWIDRNVAPEPWLHAPSQTAWLLVTLFLAGTALKRWLSDRRLETIIPPGYEPSAAGCILFAVGILTSIWWSEAFGTEVLGVPAIFRPPNLLQIAGGVLIVTGPLRAAIARGELVAGPTALISATMVFAAITFFSQFNHPYINYWAAHAIGGYPYNPNPVHTY